MSNDVVSGVFRSTRGRPVRRDQGTIIADEEAKKNGHKPAPTPDPLDYSLSEIEPPQAKKMLETELMKNTEPTTLGGTSLGSLKTALIKIAEYKSETLNATDEESLRRAGIIINTAKLPTPSGTTRIDKLPKPQAGIAAYAAGPTTQTLHRIQDIDTFDAMAFGFASSARSSTLGQ